MTIYGVNVLWDVNAVNGKVNMTVEDVTESVRLIIEQAEREARMEVVRRVHEANNQEDEEKVRYYCPSIFVNDVLDAIERENSDK